MFILRNRKFLMQKNILNEDSKDGRKLNLYVDLTAVAN